MCSSSSPAWHWPASQHPAAVSNPSCSSPAGKQVLKEKLREALEANKALQAQLGKGGAAAAGGARVALGAENKENAV